jgi:hypothetical protein
MSAGSPVTDSYSSPKKKEKGFLTKALSGWVQKKKKDRYEFKIRICTMIALKEQYQFQLAWRSESELDSKSRSGLIHFKKRPPNKDKNEVTLKY